MLTKSLCAALAAFVVTQPVLAADNTPFDAVSSDIATGTRTQMVRVGLRSDWSARWFQSNGTHLSGYWEASAGAWRANRWQDVEGRHQNLWDVGITPMFRFENDSKLGMYYEGGIGMHRLSKIYDNDTYRLSTHFQFGDRLGIGYVLDKHWEFGAKLEHFSNGGYKKPNAGVNFVALNASYHF